jgi:hypothetical protein
MSSKDAEQARKGVMVSIIINICSITFLSYGAYTHDELDLLCLLLALQQLGQNIG